MAIYSLDGVDLDDERQRWILSEGSALATRGAPENVSISIPERFGVLPISPTVLKSSTVALKFTVFSWEDGRNGNRCKGGLNRLEFNLRALLGMLTVFGRPRQLGYTPQGNLLKVADVRLASSLEPVLHPEAEVAQLTAVFEVMSGLWRDPQPTVANLSDLSPLAGGNMPIPDAWLLLEPQGSRCSLTDKVSGATFTFSGVMGAGERLLVDVGGYRAWKNPSSDWGVVSGSKVADAEISTGPGGFVLHPDPAGKLSVEAIGCTGYIRAGRSY